MAEKQMTVLEGIIEEVSLELYQKLWNALPSEDQTEESSKAVGLNSRETTLFVIQRFMDKFNAAAEELKAQPDEQ
ncbi:MAG UNVERIFIED_CONTAM: hypothetical protein LVQ98_09230 [Rickettsiaceae bacterium]|jgi:hypothetical protein